MAAKLVILALALSICSVKSQSVGCCSPSSGAQSSCGYGPSQSQTTSGLTASPQLQLAPGQGCNLQAIPLFLSQSQGSNLRKAQAAVSVPKQSFQVSSVPQTQSYPAQCNQACSPQVISAPVSTITIPPSACPTIIDNSISNCLANALQMIIAKDFIKCANSNNINQDCDDDLSSFIKNLNANQLSSCACQTSTIQCYEPEQTSSYDWEKLLSYLNEDKKKTPEPASDNNLDYFYKYLKEKGQTADQITKQQPCEVQTYSPCVQSDSEKDLFQAITTYLSGNSCDTYCNSGNIAGVAFPEEIPAQLICNYGYMPTTVPVVSFTVQPLCDNNCNYIVGSQAC